MKWLVLFLLFSCGKHKTPEAVDLLDADGDQILNSMEASESDKHIANFEPLGSIKGSLKFNHTTPVELTFANKMSSHKDALKLMVGRSDDISYREYFSEWSRVEFDHKVKPVDLKKNFYTLHLHFESNGTVPEEVILINKDEKIFLGNWSSIMRIDLSKAQLEDLLSGRAHLAFRKKFQKTEQYNVTADESIKNKTYRVYLYDGEKTRVYYISKEFPFDHFKDLMKISQTEIYEMDKIFFSSPEQLNKKWFERKFKNGDLALVLSSAVEMRENLLQRFEYQKTVLQRINGRPQSPLSFKNKPAATVYLKMTSLKTERFFVETERNIEYKVGNLAREGHVYQCLHKLRSVAEERKVPTSIYDFYQNLEVTNANLIQIEENLAEDRFSWEIKMTSEVGNTIFSVSPRAPSTYVITGEYGQKCKNKATALKLVDAQETNTEGKLSFTIESFVEKLD